MEYVEAEGQTIDDAIERALQQLGVERDRVEIEIVENASRGIFGLGGRKAKVRATLRSPLNLDAETLQTSAPTGPAPAKESRPQTPSAPVSAPPPVKPQDPPPTRHVVDPPPRSASKTSADAPVDEKVLAQARKTLEEVIRLIGVEGQVEIAQDAEGPRLIIAGDTSGVLIGRRGQTLDALEYFINRTVSREEEGSLHLVVDSQDYRARRKDALVNMARRLGERARRRGKTVTLNPMSPRDRRIVHLALQDDPSLTTRSSGRGYFRKLLIIPSGERRGGRARAS